MRHNDRRQGQARPRRRITIAGTGLALALTAAGPASASFTQDVGSPFGAGSVPADVVAADFNADGRTDLADVNNGAANVSVLLRQPTGGFASEFGSPFAVGTLPDAMTVADFNGDGRPDLAVGNYNADSVSSLLRQPGGGFTSEGDITVAGHSTAVAAADFTGDGRPDLATTKESANKVSILVRGVGGSFGIGPAPATGASPEDLTIADFNGDGKPDIATANLVSDSVSVLLGQGSGNFSSEGDITVPGHSRGIVAADFNGDGRPDLAVTKFNINQVSILLRKASGGFAEEAGTPFDVGSDPRGVVAADFNHDGRPDIAIANHGSRNVSVLLRNAAGGFTPDPSSPLPTAGAASRIDAADINGDGKTDIVSANEDTANLSVLLNTTPDPAGTPTPPTILPGAPGPTPIATPISATAKRIKAHLRLSWLVSSRAVTLTSAVLSEIPAGTTVRVSCATCKLKSKLKKLTVKGTKVTVTGLRNKRLRRGATFSITITKPGYVGQVLSRTVRRYGKSASAIRRAAADPFTEKTRCVPVGKTLPAKTC
ncbi:VCBS repeat-containing protein [Baekduia soli]|uniref:VCBS repeat-containing protein n=1 Tax=Baekduia soli TaxID=496014 RepID=A0A5B8UA86_9ACTN|nr:VCBS repeat-containing protein [Baekduia soli]QEC49521.1 VCBS repeat-containing protein [Baekduia soli]